MLLTAGLPKLLLTPSNSSDHIWHGGLPWLKPADLGWGFGHSLNHPPGSLTCCPGVHGGLFPKCGNVGSVTLAS